jgi:hypothetical protein
MLSAHSGFARRIQIGRTARYYRAGFDGTPSTIGRPENSRGGRNGRWQIDRRILAKPLEGKAGRFAVSEPFGATVQAGQRGEVWASSDLGEVGGSLPARQGYTPFATGWVRRWQTLVCLQQLYSAPCGTRISRPRCASTFTRTTIRSARRLLKSNHYNCSD